ncbi:hypothetical protein [Amycolatopsis pithecellobii]|uniref:Uncharacterized protein n=1 Tax=Amycolatopsis pithecellobii TaxID=664692 RepID=A0A6N7Z5W3_9PSEU|nr:hypothetical protein [Amycolatopsis pithecellobii]MTD56181.1 hypothetical protein [Amycolatopsis pithecellobii]
MKQQNTSAQRGPARAGRWLARALLVVGGAVAGTAAAWAIGTASASAETAPPTATSVQQGDEATPVTDAVLGATDDVLLGTAQLAGDTAGAAVRAGTQSPDGIARSQEAANDVTDAVHDFTQHVVTKPAERLLGSAEQITRKPQNAPRVISQALTTPPDLWSFLHPSGSGLVHLPALPALPGTHAIGQHTSAGSPVVLPQAAPQLADAMGPIATVLPQAHWAATHFDSGDDAGLRHHGDQTDRFPFAPVRGPLAPSGVPLTPGGSIAGGHVDGPLLGVPAGAVSFVNAYGERAVRFGIRHTPVEPGSQPGVTPD